MGIKMLKYKVYRTLGRIDKDVDEHKLVAVEEGTDIYEVEDAIIRAVITDLEESEEYSQHKATAYAPESVESFRQNKRYDYYCSGIVMPESADKNIILEYGIVEDAVEKR